MPGTKTDTMSQRAPIIAFLFKEIKRFNIEEKYKKKEIESKDYQGAGSW